MHLPVTTVLIAKSGLLVRLKLSALFPFTLYENIFGVDVSPKILTLITAPIQLSLKCLVDFNGY